MQILINRDAQKRATAIYVLVDEPYDPYDQDTFDKLLEDLDLGIPVVLIEHPDSPEFYELPRNRVGARLQDEGYQVWMQGAEGNASNLKTGQRVWSEVPSLSLFHYV